MAVKCPGSAKRQLSVSCHVTCENTAEFGPGLPHLATWPQDCPLIARPAKDPVGRSNQAEGARGACSHTYLCVSQKRGGGQEEAVSSEEINVLGEDWWESVCVSKGKQVTKPLWLSIQFLLFPFWPGRSTKRN
ncbi:hypothetical protein AAFF_G00262210 [Aldrovandia affinis]|uniref:Uncharacterized protein n=1 Tax=Aldrovandia affinis TaxID=143900 RepID=A0AAD7SSQ9_9TELE|nr:hypothetical protein AAFF_G00262210 [Aldrovandia affinis]